MKHLSLEGILFQSFEIFKLDLAENRFKVFIQLIKQEILTSKMSLLSLCQTIAPELVQMLTPYTLKLNQFSSSDFN